MHNFTQEDLLQYLYKETSTELTAEIGAALQSDYILKEQLEALTIAQQQLDTVPFMSPRNSSIESIMNYAEKAMGELTEH